MAIEHFWTLFLDRDGVINHRLPGKYVRTWEEFEWIEGSLEAIVKMTNKVQRIVVVTNQQGVGKGLMTEAELDIVHQKMCAEVEAAGGRIDKVYHCPELAINNPKCRKPNPGMAIQAQKDFPEIEYEFSLMVGDSITDMQFGSILGMVNIFIESNVEEVFELGRRVAEGDVKNQVPVDFQFPNLAEFAKHILEEK